MQDKTGQTVSEAAQLLGISRDAVRKRIQRGTLAAEKQEGTWTIYLDNVLDDGSQTQDTGQDGHFWDLINQQRAEIERLKAELAHERARVDQLIQRIPPQITEAAATLDDRPPRKTLLQRIFGR